MERTISLLGLICFIGIAYLVSTKRSEINWRTVVAGLILQLSLGFFVLKTELGEQIFGWLGERFQLLLGYSMEGSNFIFGSLTDVSKNDFIFFVQVLPTVIFFSALMAALYYLNIMQKIIYISAKIMMKVMGTSGSESFATAANVFAGMTEAPLAVLPYVKRMTQSELFAMMAGGLSTIAGGVMMAYIGMGVSAKHLLTASIMSAPAALLIAKIMIPETQQSETAGQSTVQADVKYTNLLEATTDGASVGLKLALNVAAMLIAFVALIAMLNGLLGFTGELFGFEGLSLEWLLGFIFAPFAWLMGIPADEIRTVGSMLGKKVVFNEFIAYLDLMAMKENLSERSVTITTYALCGFTNFAAVAIQVGGLGALIPERRADMASLSMRALLAGVLACMMTACVAGLMIT
ncbi:MAG: NupC/NupG family nucleoside CNT transporter [Lentisphaeria bacterium]|nr:NupC/NupG family nucleoside CNT transporter [Lentisphaeria bacterium]